MTQQGSRPIGRHTPPVRRLSAPAEPRIGPTDEELEPLMRAWRKELGMEDERPQPEHDRDCGD